MHGTGTVSPSAKRSGSLRRPPAKVSSLTPRFALNVDATSSYGCVPMEMEIGSGFFFASARSAKRRMLFGVTMSMPVMFRSLSIRRYMPALMPNSGSSAMTTPPVIIGPPSMTENTGTGRS